MDKQKQIEEKKEITKELDKVYPNAKFTNGWIAEVLYKLGYRKIPENAVVLTQEEWAIHNEQFAQAMYQKEVNTRKETAKEICNLILEHWQGHDLVECDWLRVAISEKYGVEVE